MTLENKPPQRELTPEEEAEYSLQLREDLQKYPEADYFGNAANFPETFEEFFKKRKEAKARILGALQSTGRQTFKEVADDFNKPFLDRVEEVRNNPGEFVAELFPLTDWQKQLVNSMQEGIKKPSINTGLSGRTIVIGAGVSGMVTERLIIALREAGASAIAIDSLSELTDPKRSDAILITESPRARENLVSQLIFETGRQLGKTETFKEAMHRALEDSAYKPPVLKERKKKKKIRMKSPFPGSGHY